MSKLTPIKLIPTYKDYLWGGDKLRSVYGKKTEIFPLAESWELSCHKDGLSRISGGVYDGETLEHYINENPEHLGTLRKSDELPILDSIVSDGKSVVGNVKNSNNSQKHLKLNFVQ